MHNLDPAPAPALNSNEISDMIGMDPQGNDNNLFNKGYASNLQCELNYMFFCNQNRSNQRAWISEPSSGKHVQLLALSDFSHQYILSYVCDIGCVQKNG